ncbi:hypothetical protein OG758_04710 [Streptomyces sp. NBC_01474]|uniref:hypothetical protein n=1 Tax=unclassified Streptomyces TaxID=2593676 RepID=UPI002DD8F03F|nr:MULTISPECIES: hypothetical protein [unclassified Streptomyces]WSD93546.1 hypothetical protein OG758_04710 [Streptomyces sp. NBC_01474]
MSGWVVDLVLAVVVTGLEAVALALFWFRESVKAWAAQGRSVPCWTRRVVVVLGVGSTLPGLAVAGFFEACLEAAAVSQALVASVLGSLLALGLATEARRWFSRGRRKRGTQR